MKVLVSGASGFLGHYVVSRLLTSNHSVRAIIRPTSPDPSWRDEVEIFRADLRVHENLASAFESIDAVIHLAAATSGSEDSQFASTVVATERFLEAMARSSVKRLIHVSSLVVYDWSQAKGTLDEKTPLRTDIYDMGAYTIAKVWQERVVAKNATSNSWALTIMRPGFIWGANHAEIAGMGRHFGQIYLMFGPLVRLPLCHVVNCADCLVRAVESAATVGESFNVIDQDSVRVWRYVHEYARRSGQRGFPLPLPYSVGFGIARLASLSSRMLFGRKGKLPSLLTPRRFEAQFKPVRFSNQKLRDVLNWTPPLDFSECLNVTYRQSEAA